MTAWTTVIFYAASFGPFGAQQTQKELRKDAICCE